MSQNEIGVVFADVATVGEAGGAKLLTLLARPVNNTAKETTVPELSVVSKLFEDTLYLFFCEIHASHGETLVVSVV